LADGLLVTFAGLSSRAETVSRPRMLAAAAPATNKHTSARIVIVLVTQGSVSAANVPDKSPLIMA
jgi:hypothetical protein